MLKQLILLGFFFLSVQSGFLLIGALLSTLLGGAGLILNTLFGSTPSVRTWNC